MTGRLLGGMDMCAGGGGSVASGSSSVGGGGASAAPAPSVDSAESLAALLADGPNPALLVFDLDYTVWPFDCDKDVIAPFIPSQFGGVLDRYGRPSNAFPNVPAIFAALVDAGVPIAYASRNPSAGPVEALLRAIAITPRTRPEVRCLWDALPNRNLFHAYSSAGYGRGKARHFAAIQAACGVAFRDMLFFDDLYDNIKQAQAQGTTSVHLGRRGLTFEAVAAGISGWRDRQQQREQSNADAAAAATAATAAAAAAATAAAATAAAAAAATPPGKEATE